LIPRIGQASYTQEILGSKDSPESPGDIRSILDFYFRPVDPEETESLYEAKLLLTLDLLDGQAGYTLIGRNAGLSKLSPPTKWAYDSPRKHPPNQPAKGQQKRGAKMVSKVTPPAKIEDKRINRGIEADPDNPEWTPEDFARARPAEEVLPPDLYQGAVKRYRGQRGPQKTPVKQDIKLRIDPDILASFKATGPGWQSRMNDALRRALPNLTAPRKNPESDPSRKVKSGTRP
jgi:uncharacterized protein (DUF4415 family)